MIHREALYSQSSVPGRLHVVAEDGVESEISPSQVSMLPSGYETSVVGRMPVALVDWHGGSYCAIDDSL